MLHRSVLVIFFFLAACSPAQTPVGQPTVVRIHASPATRPWLSKAYDCAEKLQLLLEEVNDPRNASLSLRLGEPQELTTPAYQIDQDDVLVITQRESPLQNMTLAEVQNLFTRPDLQNIQVWGFAPGEDVQQVFAQEVLRGQMLTSLARIAANPQQMSDVLNQDKNAVGILPRHWKMGSVRDIFTIPNVPVLALVGPGPQDSIKALLACLQKK